jgi:hypothetical protein
VSPPKDQIALDASLAEEEEEVKEGDPMGKIRVVFMDQFQWAIDKEIAGIKSKVSANQWNETMTDLTKDKGCGLDAELVRKSNYVDFEELYQQFRLMVSNWIAEGGEVKKGMESILFNNKLPDYEKRKRMQIFIGSTLLSWFYPDSQKWEVPVSFLRKDCRVIKSPEACSGTCVWKEEGNKGGKCLLHVNETTSLGQQEGEREVSTPKLFTRRVIDELVRFPARRKQLMRRGYISKVTKIMEPIRQGDEYIIPEASPTWTNLLRFEWTKTVLEKPLYYEEMSREVNESEELEEEKKEIPEVIKPAEPKKMKLKLSRPAKLNVEQLPANEIQAPKKMKLKLAGIPAAAPPPLASKAPKMKLKLAKPSVAPLAAPLAAPPVKMKLKLASANKNETRRKIRFAPNVKNNTSRKNR